MFYPFIVTFNFVEIMSKNWELRKFFFLLSIYSSYRLPDVYKTKKKTKPAVVCHVTVNMCNVLCFWGHCLGRKCQKQVKSADSQDSVHRYELIVSLKLHHFICLQLWCSNIWSKLHTSHYEWTVTILAFHSLYYFVAVAISGTDFLAQNEHTHLILEEKNG